MARKLLSVLIAAVLLFSAALLDGVVTETGIPDQGAGGESYVFALSEVAPYEGEPFAELNGGVPLFDEYLLSEDSFERYGELDRLGRCTAALANIGKDLMPDGPRESISQIKPTGWHLVRYDELGSDLYLFNRCHLIARQLTGEDANERNLITGTRYMNVSGLLPFENRVAEYVRTTGNHVLYRAEPVFEGNELVCRGVHLEALSVEDEGRGICFNVFVYNVQPGIIIDYATGDSRSDGTWAAAHESEGEDKNASKEGGDADTGRAADDGSIEDGGRERSPEGAGQRSQADTELRLPEGVERCSAEEARYALNLNTGKFHLPDCESVGYMSEKNKYYTDSSREDIIKAGYDPCKNCNP
ncbi:MAG: DNA/RNA non-specific endonuclease [Firmicutes bacterium]|nr:DNA/RNA non-specific endonuclease [Bacillota bacterium]